LHTCAIADGKAYCWGDNANGQLGTYWGYGWFLSFPVAVDATGVLSGKTVTAISGGFLHTCAVADGKAYCWGFNIRGQLGNGTTTDSAVPVAVNTSGVLNGKTVTAVDGGDYHTCAVADGKAYCWGLNSGGELGNGMNTDSNVPVAVSTTGVLNGRTVTAVGAGSSYSCAIADGWPYCWGSNSYGQLGNGTDTDSNVPVAVNTGLLGNSGRLYTFDNPILF
jgi:alpha-tubulin suppressor-like RCC1 family protein